MPPGTKTDLDRDFRQGIADPRMYMDVSKLAKAALRGIVRDTAEIRPGLSGVLHTVHRLAPGLTLTNKDSEAVVASVGPGRLLPR
jgi:uncharacterized oxidoreductase